MKHHAPGALYLALLAAAVASADGPTTAVVPPTATPRVRMLEEPPTFGLRYTRWEPTFYTGFAPRARDPRRVHLHVGRGNQLRITLVLSDQVLADYARDLRARRDTYDALVASGRIVTTQNRALDAFRARLDELDLDGRIAAEASLDAAARRERNLELMEALNPGRVFRISMPTAEVVRRWLAELQPTDRTRMDRDRRLELLNALLPTRLWIAEMDASTRRDLAALVDAAPQGGRPDALFSERWLALLEKVAPGLYPQRGGRIEFAEFTAVHPIGTFNEYTDYKGRKIPLYPTPGRRALTTHQRTKTVDHIPTVPAYSYSPWIPYMHVGTKLHNSFHTLWWRMRPNETAFLPGPWRDASDEPYLWLLSRGPMSSGCTHLTTGHIAELRQVLPADSDALYAIDAFLNRSYDFDVFDIDGDFAPEVMGVRYFVAYSLRNKRPHRLRVRNERRAYYDWLYAGELRLAEGGAGSFAGAHAGRFVERTARRGRLHREIPLYEAAYEPERIQFYRLVDIAFARELRRAGADHAFVDPGGP